ncbi:MAG: bifunctional YncE family protein/alkaline phosphatase family protein, partial [Bacteroidales bacterium]|nr:bifunctional YncE family protein/alkaline phosphatase family protein [Bacteroidales bacterium]
LPYNRWINPAGKQLFFGNQLLENHALDCALSPDGKWLAVEGRYHIVIISTKEQEISSVFPLTQYFRRGNPRNTFSGITWRTGPAGYSLYWSAVLNYRQSKVIRANWNGRELTVDTTFLFARKSPAKLALANEVLLRDEDGQTFLYTVLNGNNTVEKRNADTGDSVWSVAVGVAPFGITEANGKLYVTNWAGSVPGSRETSVAGVPWEKSKVDSLTGATSEGTVSVIDPESGKVIHEIQVGLHPNDIIADPHNRFVYVANSNSDIVSVIDSRTDRITETVSVRLAQDHNPYFGDSPNGLGISSDGRTLYVANGMDNALAVVKLGRLASSAGKRERSRVTGFIPTGAYPGSVAVLNNSWLFVANIEGEGAHIPNQTADKQRVSYNAHHMMASVSVIPVPKRKKLAKQTRRVINSNQFFRLELTGLKPRKGIAPVPVPERIGEPSVFKHVVYIIKENRTYDQVLGDVSAGDGDTALCTFGKKVTPNIHQLVDDFLLMDNFYVSGKSSAEGHMWSDASIVTDYVEKSVRGWFRSYPHVLADALVYAPTGFLWDNALKHGKKVRVYGEATVPEFDPKLHWSDIYRKFKNGEPFSFRNVTTIKPVEKILSQNYPGYDHHAIPDVLRAKAFIDELHTYEKMKGDQWPDLIIMALPNDHTAGTAPGYPTPRAMVADNDLALGQIVQAITHSRFWKNTVIVVTEDDSQAGWDHVSAYRTVGMVISPWSRLGKTIHTNYNQPSMIRTIEQILGLPPMNIQDATAMPMFDCFTGSRDLTPYHVLLNQIPLDEMNPDLNRLKGMALRYARKSMDPMFERIDSGDDALLNRILWHAVKGNRAYPKWYSGRDDDD